MGRDMDQEEARRQRHKFPGRIPLVFLEYNKPKATKKLLVPTTMTVKGLCDHMTTDCKIKIPVDVVRNCTLNDKPIADLNMNAKLRDLDVENDFMYLRTLETSEKSVPCQEGRQQSDDDLGGGDDDEWTLVGLPNLGNTCFMNASLQCLFNATLLRLLVQNNGAVSSSLLAVIAAYCSKKPDRRTALRSLLQAVAAKSGNLALGEVGTQQDAREFTCGLLDGLQEEEEQAGQEEQPQEMHEQSSAQVRDNGLIRRHFGVSTSRTLTCLECGRISKKTQVSSCLFVELLSDVANGGGEVRTTRDLEQLGEVPLQALLKGSTPEEIIHGYDCEGCAKDSAQVEELAKRRPNAASSTDLTATGEVLVIVLLRFTSLRQDSMGELEEVKVRRQVAFSPYMTLPTGVEYSLHGVVSHLGSNISGGHYLSVVRDHSSGEWVCCNDATLTSAKMSGGLPEIAGDPYMLFYRRVEHAADERHAPNAPPQQPSGEHAFQPPSRTEHVKTAEEPRDAEPGHCSSSDAAAAIPKARDEHHVDNWDEQSMVCQKVVVQCMKVDEDEPRLLLLQQHMQVDELQHILYEHYRQHSCLEEQDPERLAVTIWAGEEFVVLNRPEQRLDDLLERYRVDGELPIRVSFCRGCKQLCEELELMGEEMEQIKINYQGQKEEKVPKCNAAAGQKKADTGLRQKQLKALDEGFAKQKQELVDYVKGKIRVCEAEKEALKDEHSKEIAALREQLAMKEEHSKESAALKDQLDKALLEAEKLRGKLEAESRPRESHEASTQEDQEIIAALKEKLEKAEREYEELRKKFKADTQTMVESNEDLRKRLDAVRNERNNVARAATDKLASALSQLELERRKNKVLTEDNQELRSRQALNQKASNEKAVNNMATPRDQLPAAVSEAHANELRKVELELKAVKENAAEETAALKDQLDGATTALTEEQKEKAAMKDEHEKAMSDTNAKCLELQNEVEMLKVQMAEEAAKQRMYSEDASKGAEGAGQEHRGSVCSGGSDGTWRLCNSCAGTSPKGSAASGFEEGSVFAGSHEPSIIGDQDQNSEEDVKEENEQGEDVKEGGDQQEEAPEGVEEEEENEEDEEENKEEEEELYQEEREDGEEEEEEEEEEQPPQNENEEKEAKQDTLLKEASESESTGETEDISEASGSRRMECVSSSDGTWQADKGSEPSEKTPTGSQGEEREVQGGPEPQEDLSMATSEKTSASSKEEEEEEEEDKASVKTENSEVVEEEADQSHEDKEEEKQKDEHDEEKKDKDWTML